MGGEAVDGLGRFGLGQVPPDQSAVDGGFDGDLV